MHFTVNVLLFWSTYLLVYHTFPDIDSVISCSFVDLLHFPLQKYNICAQQTHHFLFFKRTWATNVEKLTKDCYKKIVTCVTSGVPSHLSVNQTRISSLFFFRMRPTNFRFKFFFIRLRLSVEKGKFFSW